MPPFKSGERPLESQVDKEMSLRPLGVDGPCGTRLRDSHEASEPLLAQHGPHYTEGAARPVAEALKVAVLLDLLFTACQPLHRGFKKQRPSPQTSTEV